MLRSEGGIFGLGAKVDVGGLIPRSSPPEVEDHLFQPERARLVGTLGPGEYLSLIDAACERDLTTVFGPSLRVDGRGFSVPEGEGVASLGCVRVPTSVRPEIVIDYGKVKLRLQDRGKHFQLAVNDIRCYEEDQETPARRIVKAVQQRMRRKVPLRLMVGLSRAWSPDDTSPRHWLQVNGICLEDSPLGDAP